jgi:hypothetical protein
MKLRLHKGAFSPFIGGFEWLRVERDWEVMGEQELGDDVLSSIVYQTWRLRKWGIAYILVGYVYALQSLLICCRGFFLSYLWEGLLMKPFI